jgi:hypothetical protein
LNFRETITDENEKAPKKVISKITCHKPFILENGKRMVIL